MGGNKTALAALELVKRTTLKGEEVAVYLDVMEFLQGIAKEEYLVLSVTDMQTLKADNKELRRQIIHLTNEKAEAIDNYVAPITPEEAGLEDIEWFLIPDGVCPKCGTMNIHYCTAMESYRCFSVKCNWQGDSCEFFKTKNA